MEDKKALSWDEYFFLTCKQIAYKSSCLSRKVGAILVRDNSIISTGYNGPARGIPHCGKDRFMKDDVVTKYIYNASVKEANSTCPRQLVPNYRSGELMNLCTAQHAEENCISNAARNGTCTLGSSLYISAPIPCKNCFSTLINAGIVEIIVEDDKPYDDYTKFIMENSNIKIRKFEI